MPGDYKDSDLLSMTPEEIAAAAARGWSKPSAADAERPEYAGVSVEPKQLAPKPSGDVWARRKAGTDLFTCPSGQTCRLRPVTPDKLMLAGVLDNVNHLEALAAKLVSKAEGEPPTPDSVPTRKDFAELLNLVNKVIPLAVAEPVVLDDPAPGEDFVQGALYASDIDLDDRLAIMSEVLKGIRQMDRFRNA